MYNACVASFLADPYQSLIRLPATKRAEVHCCRIAQEPSCEKACICVDLAAATCYPRITLLTELSK